MDWSCLIEWIEWRGRIEEIMRIWDRWTRYQNLTVFQNGGEKRRNRKPRHTKWSFQRMSVHDNRVICKVQIHARLKYSSAQILMRTPVSGTSLSSGLMAWLKFTKGYQSVPDANNFPIRFHLEHSERVQILLDISWSSCKFQFKSC